MIIKYGSLKKTENNNSSILLQRDKASQASWKTTKIFEINWMLSLSKDKVIEKEIGVAYRLKVLFHNAVFHFDWIYVDKYFRTKAEIWTIQLKTNLVSLNILINNWL